MKKFLTLLLLIVISLQTVLTAKPYSIAIIPHTIISDDETQYLSDAISEIFNGRLSGKDSVEIINQDDVHAAALLASKFGGESKAILIGAKLQADYVLFGSIIISNENISVLTKVIDVSSKTRPLIFTDHVQDINNILPKINYSATIINEKLGMTQPITEKNAAPTNKDIFTIDSNTTSTLNDSTKNSQETVVATNTSLSDSTTKKDANKDSLNIKDTTTTSKNNATTDKTANKKRGKSKAYLQNKNIADTSFGIWKSQELTVCINGIALSDLDNDGEKELIMLTPKSIQTYRYKNKKLTKIADIFKIRSKYPLSIYVADINNNGFPEMYITTLNTYQSRVLSFVVEYDGAEYKTLAKNIPYYLKIIYNDKNTPQLFGQRHRKNTPYKGSVHYMQIKNGKYVPGKMLMSLSSHNLLGFDYGSFSSKINAGVAYSKYGRLSLLSTSGKTQWESKDRYGGSPLYYQIDAGAIDNNREYLVPRITINNNNGEKRVFAVKNYEVAKNIFGKFRHYNKGQLEIFKWDGIGLESEWKSQLMRGCIRDFIVADFDNDQTNELIVALNYKQGTFFGIKAKSSLIVFELKK